MSADVPDAIARLAKGSGAQGFLLDHHLEAGRRLAALFWKAQLNQRVTMSYDPTRIGTKGGHAPQGDMALSVAEARAVEPFGLGAAAGLLVGSERCVRLSAWFAGHRGQASMAAPRRKAGAAYRPRATGAALGAEQ